MYAYEVTYDKMYLVLQEAMNGQDVDREESIDLSDVEVRVIQVIDGVIARELSVRTRCPRSQMVAERSWCLPKKEVKTTQAKYSISKLSWKISTIATSWSFSIMSVVYMHKSYFSLKFKELFHYQEFGILFLNQTYAFVYYQMDV